MRRRDRDLSGSGLQEKPRAHHFAQERVSARGAAVHTLAVSARIPVARMPETGRRRKLLQPPAAAARQPTGHTQRFC